jgi:acylphosphatase
LLFGNDELNKSSTNMTQKEIFHTSVYFSGRVQGVGFRYHTMQVAKEFEVSGYVRNVADGRVQVEAEGQKSEVEGFVAEICDRLSMFIRKTEPSESWREPVFRGFTIGR